jgi:hypothetical protein
MVPELSTRNVARQEGQKGHGIISIVVVVVVAAAAVFQWL